METYIRHLDFWEVPIVVHDTHAQRPLPHPSSAKYVDCVLSAKSIKMMMTLFKLIQTSVVPHAGSSTSATSPFFGCFFSQWEKLWTKLPLNLLCFMMIALAYKQQDSICQSKASSEKRARNVTVRRISWVDLCALNIKVGWYCVVTVRGYREDWILRIGEVHCPTGYREERDARWLRSVPAPHAPH